MQWIEYFLKNSPLDKEISKELDHRKKIHLLERMRKTRLTLSLCLIFGTIVLLTGVARVFTSYPDVDSRLSILLFIGLYFYTLPFIYKLTGNDFLMKALLLLGGVLGIVIRSLATSGIESSPFYWLSLVPLSSALIFEKKMILWSLLGSIFLAILIFYGEELGIFFGPANSTASSLAGFMGLLIASTLAAVAFDRQSMAFQEQMIKQEKEVQDSKKLASLGKMAAGVAHEVNNPLMVISGNLRQLERTIGNIELEHEDHLRIINYITKASNNISRISNIVQSLLAYGRMKSKDNFKTFNITAFIENLKQIIEDHGEISAITWPSLEGRNLSVMGDETLLTQVFINLIFNAWQATSALDYFHISIECIQRNESIEFRIIDQGKISDQDILDNMFNPFFTTKPIGQGTGLGLSLSKGILEMHGGDLYHDPLCPTTCFVIKLPYRLT